MASGEFSASLDFTFTARSALYAVVNLLRDNCVPDIRGFNPFPREGLKMCPPSSAIGYWKLILLKLGYVLGYR